MEVILAAPVVLVMGWGICEFRHAMQMAQVLNTAARSGVVAGRHPSADEKSVEAAVRSVLHKADSRLSDAEILIQIGEQPLRGLTTARTPGVRDHRKIACQITIPYEQVWNRPAMLLQGPKISGQASSN